MTGAPAAGGLGAALLAARAARRRPVATTRRTRRGRSSRRATSWSSRSARRTSPRRSSSASCTARRCGRKSINVKLRKDIGPTEVIDKELQSGEIDAYPEYLGVAVTVAAGRDDAGSTRRGDLRAGEGVLRGPRPGDQRADVVRERRRDRHHAVLRPDAAAWPRSATCGAAALHARRAARVRGSPAGPGRDAGRVRARERRSSRRSRSASSTARSTATRSTPRTCSPPTASSRAGATRCSRTPSACSASSTWRW